jgi:hypothetical protein
MKIRCSAIGKLMSTPRTKGEKLSETAKTYIQDLFKEKELGIAREFWSRYTDKGLQMEDEAIDFAGQVLGWDFVVKNEQGYENDYITGTPDVITKYLLADIKCSWDGTTFPLFDTELKNKDYYWQLQGYMWLTGLEQAELVYCLMDTPHQIVEDEVRRAHWKAGIIDEDLDLRESVQSQHTFDHLPNNLRVKRFIIRKDEEAIEKIKEKVELAREYYEQLKSIL